MSSTQERRNFLKVKKCLIAKRCEREKFGITYLKVEVLESMDYRILRLLRLAQVAPLAEQILITENLKFDLV
jgi:hypothetical protein